MRTALLSILLLLSSTIIAQETRIDSIIYRGFKRCKISFLERFIEQEIGQKVDTFRMKENQALLNSLGFFSDLGIYTESKEDSTFLIIQGKEVFTTFPFIQYGGSQENFRLKAGVSEFNFLGRGIQYLMTYDYYQRHSFFGSVSIPYYGKSNWGSRHTFNRHATLEPAGPEGSRFNFNVDRTEITSDISYEPKFGHRIYTGGGTFYEAILIAPNEVYVPTEVYEQNTTQKYIFKIEDWINKKRYYAHLVDGIENQFIGELVTTPGFPAFIKFTNQLKYFHLRNKKSVWATRLSTGISSNFTNPFPSFVLDNYVNIRGIGDRVVRGSVAITLNTEYRQTLEINPVFAVEGILFLDAGTVRAQHGEWNTISENLNVFAGTGIRLHLPFLYRMSFRFDYGINVASIDQHGFVLGIGQYF